MAIEIANAFIAAARIKGTVTAAVLASEGFDESTFTRVSAGIYDIDLTDELDETNSLVVVSAADAGGAPMIACAFVGPSHKTVRISAANAAGAATDALMVTIGVWLFKAA